MQQAIARFCTCRPQSGCLYRMRDPRDGEGARSQLRGFGQAAVLEVLGCDTLGMDAMRPARRTGPSRSVVLRDRRRA